MPETLISIEGGLDLRSSPINAPKGTLSSCYNFEKDQGPGLARRQGWVRYDGKITGPEVEDAYVVSYAVNPIGTFQYGEVVVIASAGLPTLSAICIGQSGLRGGYARGLLLAYPRQTFTNWVDLTKYPATTSYTGQTSGAFLASSQGSPVLMSDNTITVDQYNFYKRNTQLAHSAAIDPVPGRKESPLDAIFTYGDNSYAIHDCIIINFAQGKSGGGTGTIPNYQPLEGNWLTNFLTGETIGRILKITITSGSMDNSDAAGTIILYDVENDPSTLAVGTQFNLMDVFNTTTLLARVMIFNGMNTDPSLTRALMYTTYEQYVKTYTFNPSYGIDKTFPPKYAQVAAPTWTRCPMNRELPYTSVGVPASASNVCFDPQGANLYSPYEYTRLGLSNALNALSPVSSGEKFPTVATDSSTPGRWANPNRILVQDGSTSDYVGSSGLTPRGQPTSYLSGTGFDFSAIPDGSTIVGIVVRFRAKTTTAGAYHCGDLRLVSSTFPSGVGNRNAAGTGVPLTTSLADYTFGSATDTWNEVLTTQVLKDPSFGFRASFTLDLNTVGQFPSVDAYAITVYYAPLTRTVYIRNPDPAVTTNQDVPCNIIHYSIDSGDFQTRTAVGVLTVTFGPSEEAGTAAGKTRRIGPGNEIRTAPSSASNAAGGVLLAYTTAEDYPITFPPGAALDTAGSKYEVIDANFWDVPEGRAAYIVNGVENAVMYDGAFFLRIRTGRPPLEDCPRHVANHLHYLHLGFASGAVVWSEAKSPVVFIIDNASPTAGSLNFGEPVTGMLTLNGTTLGVWTDRTTRGLQGTIPLQYTPIIISPAINCIEYSLVNLVGEAVWTSYRGVETVRSVNAYGDFETLPLSAAAQLWLQTRLQVDLRIGSTPSKLVYAIGIRNKRQYRIYFADGYCYTLTLFDAGDLPVSTVQYISRPNDKRPIGIPFTNDEPYYAGVIRHIHNGTRTDGKELIFACFENQNPTIVPAADGGNSIGPYFPYGVRMDCGYMDDMQPYMPAAIEFNAFYAGYPTKVCKFQSCAIFVNAYGGTDITTYTKTDFDGPIVNGLGWSSKNDLPVFGVRIQDLTLPIVESRAFIPVPQRVIVADVAGEGIMLKMRIDVTQTSDSNPSLTSLRITHLSLSTDEEAILRS